MTHEEIIRVANLTIAVLLPEEAMRCGPLTQEEERAIINRYYNQYGAEIDDPTEEDMWYTMAEKIR